MIVCPSCKTDSPEKANFCLNCGTPLKPQANLDKQPDENDVIASSDSMTQTLKRLMPTSYVEKLIASKGKMEGERRVVTILFSDVKGSTALAENLDPEEVLEVMNGAFNVLIEPITRYEGTLARLMGDAILAFFGAPIAHEDDPYRACKAALDILEGAKKFGNKLEEEKGIKGFGVRVGINTGLVVVAEVGTDLRVEYTAMGDAVNIAARMESAAEPGTILITEDTKKLIQKYFDLLSMGSIQVKGKSTSIHTYRVLDIKKSTEAVLGDGYHSPLIGRESELRTLEHKMNELLQGQGSIISIVGTGGIGKSRLVAEFRKQKDPGLKWAEARALNYAVNNSYYVFRSLLKNYLGFHQKSSDAGMLEILFNKVEALFKEKTEEIYPFLEHFLKPQDDITETKSALLDNPLAVVGQFHYAFKELIKREILIQPVVLVWEDLQWCDLPSLELLNELLPIVSEYQLLILLQYRLDENEKRAWNFHHNNLKELADKHEIILLRPLDDNESLQLIQNVLVNTEMPIEVQEQVIKKAEGNPSFLEEVVHSVIDSSYKPDAHLPQTKIQQSEIQITGQLQNIIMARVDCLDPLDKITLQTASVIGRVFQKDMLSKIMKDNLTDSEFEKSLCELQSREFILRHLPTNLISGQSILQKEYIFKQEITQNVIYNSLLISQRQSLHNHVAEKIENDYSNNLEELAGSLALHFERGKNLSKAAHYYKIAADRAKELFANEDAVFFYSIVLRLSQKVHLGDIALAQIHESLADIFSLKAEYSMAIDHYNLSSNYYREGELLSKIFYKRGRILEHWGKYDMALENFNAGLRQLNQGSEQVLAANMFTGIGMVYFRQGNLKDAEKLNKQALQILQKKKSVLDIAEVYNNLGIIYSKSGKLEKALECHSKCLQIREEYGSSSGLAASNNNIGYVYQLKNDLKKAIEYYSKSLKYCERIGNLHGLARLYDNLSHIHITRGDQDLAMDYNLRAISILGKIAQSGENINHDVWLQSGVW